MLDDSMLPDGWHFAYDTSVPTCRLDNQPYDAESEATQHYVIDVTASASPTTTPCCWHPPGNNH